MWQHLHVEASMELGGHMYTGIHMQIVLCDQGGDKTFYFSLNYSGQKILHETNQQYMYMYNVYSSCKAHTCLYGLCS